MSKLQGHNPQLQQNVAQVLAALEGLLQSKQEDIQALEVQLNAYACIEICLISTP